MIKINNFEFFEPSSISNGGHRVVKANRKIVKEKLKMVFRIS